MTCRRLATIALALLLVTAAGCLPALLGSAGGIGVIEDPSVRRYLAPLSILEEGSCDIAGVPGERQRITMHCRVFQTTAGDRLVGVYDRIVDRLAVLLLLHDDGRQEVLWQPLHRATVHPGRVHLL